jgi:hypothetical protein
MLTAAVKSSPAIASCQQHHAKVSRQWFATILKTQKL